MYWKRKTLLKICLNSQYFIAILQPVKLETQQEILKKWWNLSQQIGAFQLYPSWFFSPSCSYDIGHQDKIDKTMGTKRIKMYSLYKTEETFGNRTSKNMVSTTAINDWVLHDHKPESFLH